MKLSISWIFYHINADWKKVDINNLISKFNRTTAEIESFKQINTDLNNLFAATVKDVSEQSTILFCPEINKEIELPKRELLKKDQIFLINKQNGNYFWARSLNLGGDKDFILPELFMDSESIKGKWKEQFEIQDYIIEVDNKSVTHRPDLWGHRGFAREIAAILDLEFLPLKNFIDSIDISEHDNPFSIKIENENICKRFSTAYIKEIKNISSVLPTVVRLSRIDSKSINSIVDATNYVMFDLGQPMHAFDANKIRGKIITPRFAKDGEKLTLLDNQTIELTSNDLVIADESGPIALAGIMGGKNSEVDQNTKSLLIESACFDASTIRKSSIRLKTRTEASARFEKSLDPEQTVIAIERFSKILNFALKFVGSKTEINKIGSLGISSKEKVIEIEHKFIEKRLGTVIDSNCIIKILEKLEFKVDIQQEKYIIKVPSFRSSKDVEIPEDIVEEIGRFLGYDNIPFILPFKQMIPSDIKNVVKIRKIKELMAFACNMHEVQNYPFYDEAFLNEINWKPENSISMVSPVSENWKQLVTSLIPHLLKDIGQNSTKEQMNFFELNRIWNLKNNQPLEKKVLSGIFYSHNKQINFYACKQKIDLLFELLKINVEWKKRTETNTFVDSWYAKYQSADLMSEGIKIGVAGLILPEFLNKVVQKGEAFIFELDADFLINTMPSIIKFKSMTKYQSSYLDISFLINLDKTVQQISDIIKNSDSKIYQVDLLDIFEKPEWKDKKSLTFRYHFVDQHKTLIKEEIDEIANKVNNEITKIGGQLR